jgi:SAM-dependent methyltransferase
MSIQTPSVGDDYVLASGEAAEARLHLLDRVFGAFSRGLLKDAGLARGMHVADIGCGVGDLAIWLAAEVGPTGAVAGIDASVEQLAVAQAGARAKGATNLALSHGDAYATGLEYGAFDLVCCRFLLCHLSRPLDGLREMRALLKPGGSLVVIEPDLNRVGSDPVSAAYERINAVALQAGTLRGVDYAIGSLVHRHVSDAAFRIDDVRVCEPAFLRGPEKRFWAHTYSEAAPAFVRAGLITQREMDDALREMAEVSDDETRVMYMGRTVGVRARLMI